MPATFDETFTERWSRRLITGPALVAVAPAYLAALPATLGVAATADLARGRPWTATRFVAALGANLGIHVAGFAGIFGAWLMGGERERELEQRLQVWFAESIWRSLEALYSVELEVSGDECLVEDGPIIVLSRHASLLDTLLPLLILGGRHDWRSRYVMKRELLWDPCLDALGHRWPTAFVRRDAGDPREIEHVAMLGDRLEGRDAIVLFPETTRFSEDKRSALVGAGDSDLAARAARLTHVLPLEPEGPLALLDVDRRLDVVFCAHVGLEGLGRVEDVMSDRLLGCRVKADFWRVAHAEIPEGQEARRRWLDQQWERVDRWVGDNRESHPGGGHLERMRA